MADHQYDKLAQAFGKSQDAPRPTNLPPAPENVTPAPPPVRDDVRMKRATFAFPVEFLERLDALQQRWKRERRPVTKDQMLTTALEIYLRMHEDL